MVIHKKLMFFVALIWLCSPVVYAKTAIPEKTLPASAVVETAASAVVAGEKNEPLLVSLLGNEIFTVKTSPVASLTPAARAKLIQGNVKEFADSDQELQLLKSTERPEGVAIGTAENVLMVLTPDDAKQADMSLTDLAQQTLGQLKNAVSAYRTQHSWKTYVFGAGLTLVSVIGLWAALYWNRRAFKFLTNKAATMHEVWHEGIHFKKIQVVSSSQIEAVVLLLLKALRILVVLLLLYFFLPLILSFFPETRKLGATIFDYLLTPFSSIFFTIVKYIPNMFYIFVIGVIANYVLKLISYVFDLIERGELKFDWFYDDWARPTYQIVRFLVIVTALISAYPYIPGSSSEAFQGVGLVLGAIISFASSSAISNIVAGVILTYTRAFRLNDRIKIGDTVGDVVEKTLLVTRVKTIKHVIITIPNSLVMGAQIINYSTSAAEGEGVILHTTITIGYDVPWKQVEGLMIAAAMKTEKLLQTPAPFVLQTSLDDWYVAYEINAYTKFPEKMALIYSELHRRIQEEFDMAGVEIMSSHYMTLRDGNASTVPSVLAAKDYKIPAFQVAVDGK